MPRKRKQRPPHFCRNPECGEYLDPEWAEPQQKYCSDKCRNRYWYLLNKGHHKDIYAKQRKKWERSPTGKRAGVPIRRWIKFPKDFQ